MNPNVITVQTPLPFVAKSARDFENIAAARLKRARRATRRLWLRTCMAVPRRHRGRLA